MQEAFKKVEKDAFRFSAENEKLKKTIESLQEEVDNLRKDASVMRYILDHAAAANAPAKEEKPKYVPKPFTKKVEEEAPVDNVIVDTPVTKKSRATKDVTDDEDDTFYDIMSIFNK